MDIDYHRKLLAFGKYLERQRESLKEDGTIPAWKRQKWEKGLVNCKHCANNRFAGSPQTVHCLESALQTCPKDNYKLWIEATELNIVKESEFIEEYEMSI